MTDGVAPVLTLAHVFKRFDHTQALSDVSLDLYPGEIHALLGENGAGKSTLIKIMTGVHQPDEGEMRLDGQPVHVRSATRRSALGIAAIYQEPMVFPGPERRREHLHQPRESRPHRRLEAHLQGGRGDPRPARREPRRPRSRLEA